MRLLIIEAAGEDWRPDARGAHPLVTTSEWANNMSTAQRQAASKLGVTRDMHNLMTGGGGMLAPRHIAAHFRWEGDGKPAVKSIFCRRQRLFEARTALQSGTSATNVFQRVYGHTAAAVKATPMLPMI